MLQLIALCLFFRICCRVSIKGSNNACKAESGRSTVYRFEIVNPQRAELELLGTHARHDLGL